MTYTEVVSLCKPIESREDNFFRRLTPNSLKCGIIYISEYELKKKSWRVVEEINSYKFWDIQCTMSGSFRKTASLILNTISYKYGKIVTMNKCWSYFQSAMIGWKCFFLWSIHVITHHFRGSFRDLVNSIWACWDCSCLSYLLTHTLSSPKY